jgi:hypothetical protein
MANQISEATRRTLFDALRLCPWRWWGRLDEVEFLARVFDLEALPSYDYRFKTMSGDILQHRVRNPEDWDDDWVFSDGRLNLVDGPDETLLRFLAEMLHPIVRKDEEATSGLLATINRYLEPDGFQMVEVDRMSGKPLFAGVRVLSGMDGPIEAARKVADELSSSHVSAQITRMQTSVVKDPALAIGSAKEFVESICKGILDARGDVRTGKEDFPPLVSMTRDALGLKVNPKSDVSLKSMLGALGTITNSIAEMRGQLGTGHGGTPDTDQPPVEVARLAVNVAMALGVFLWEVHRSRAQ